MYQCYTFMQFHYKMCWYCQILGCKVWGAKCGSAKFWGAKCGGAKCKAQSIGCKIWGRKLLGCKVWGCKVWGHKVGKPVPIIIVEWHLCFLLKARFDKIQGACQENNLPQLLLIQSL